MTAAEMKNQVTSKYNEGQDITLWTVKGEKGVPTAMKVKIIKFNPYGVLTEHNGYKETFSYWEIKTMSAKPSTNKNIVIPEKLKAEGHHKYNSVVAAAY